MRTIKVKFTWTELMRISETRSTFKNVTTGVQDLTFEEIEKFHAGNQKSFEKTSGAYGYLADDFGHCSVKMNIENLKRKIETRNVVYEVNLDCPELKFFPLVKTQKEFSAFNREVQACGSLD